MPAMRCLHGFALRNARYRCLVRSVPPRYRSATSIINLFEDRLPASLDFAEHTHYSNVQVLDAMLAHITVACDIEGRTGYRRIIMHFLHDMEVLPEDLRHLLLSNMNSLSAIDIELIHVCE